MSSFTKTPNQVYDAMPAMNESELRVTMALVRLTYGYHRDECKATFDTLQEMTGMSRQGVTNGIQAVRERGLFAECTKRSWWRIVSEVDQNSPPSRPNDEAEQSTKLTDSVYLVDQNSLPSRPSTSGSKENYKENFKEAEPQPSPPPDPVLELKDHFTNITGIFPGRHNYAADWEAPLEAILNGAGGVDVAKQRMSDAVEFARASPKRYTIASPRSITTIIANMPEANGNGKVKVGAR